MVSAQQLEGLREFARSTRRGANIQTAIQARIAGLLVEMIETTDPLQRESLGMCVEALSRESHSIVEHARANGKVGLDAGKAEMEAAAIIETVVRDAEAEASELQSQSRQAASDTQAAVKATISAVKGLEASYVGIYDGPEHSALRKAIKAHCKSAVSDLKDMQRRGTAMVVEPAEWIAECLQPNLDASLSEHLDEVQN